MMNELWDIKTGDCREILETLPEKSVQCVVTSPPYWGQRDYGTTEFTGGDPDCDHIAPVNRTAAGFNERYHGKKFATDKQGETPGAYVGQCGKCGSEQINAGIGLELNVSEWVESMVQVFRGVRRVLRDDGTVWLNLGDKYTGSGPGGGGWNDPGRAIGNRGFSDRSGSRTPGYKPKDLIGLPWRVAFALQDDGWYLRRDIIWHKPNPMPESVTDRPATAHEYIFLLTKKPKYFYDQDAVTQDVSPGTHARISQDLENQIGSERAHGGGGKKSNGNMKAVFRSPKTVANPKADRIKNNSSFADATAMPVTQRNLRSVWKIPTQAFGGPHYATYPEKLVEPCIKAGTSEAGECPECGKPWRRQTEVDYVNKGGRTSNGPRSEERKHLPYGSPGFAKRLEKQTSTTGWRSTCNHEDGPVPQTILDPFSGAGTTGLVAVKHGRQYIGIELNPEYAEMSRKRIVAGVGVRSPETSTAIGIPAQGSMALNIST